MPIGVGVGLIISSAIGAGAAIAGAKMQSGAAKSAARQQQDASDRAIQFQRGQWNWLQQAQAPYLQSGYDALSNLNRFQASLQPWTQPFNASGPPPGGYTIPSPPYPSAPVWSSTPQVSALMPTGQQGPPQATVRDAYNPGLAPQPRISPNGISLASATRPTTPVSVGQSAGQGWQPTQSQPAAGTLAEPMVVLRAPTGETQAVPQSQAPMYLAVGAVQIG